MASHRPNLYRTPSEGERYFLRRLLHHVPGIKSYEHLKCWDGSNFDNTPRPTFKAVCVLLGLLEDDSEWETCLLEASVYKRSGQLRRLFCAILIHNNVQDPPALWDFFKAHLCSDVLARYRTQAHDRHLSLNDQIEQDMLRKINSILMRMDPRKNLTSFGLLLPPKEEEPASRWMHKVEHALNYDRTIQRAAANSSREKFLPEQKALYDDVMTAVDEFCSTTEHLERKVTGHSAFFVQAPAGTGDTFTMNCLIATVRVRGEIAYRGSRQL